MTSFNVLLPELLSHVSTEGRSLLTALADTDGRASSADFHAAQIGLRNRHQLARTLKRDGLPPLEELAGWVSVIAWTAAWERDGTSLFRSATQTRREPATCYRTVRRITGLSWREVCDVGLPWVLLRFRQRCATSVAALPRAGLARYAWTDTKHSAAT